MTTGFEKILQCLQCCTAQCQYAHRMANFQATGLEPTVTASRYQSLATNTPEKHTRTWLPFGGVTFSSHIHPHPYPPTIKTPHSQSTLREAYAIDRRNQVGASILSGQSLIISTLQATILAAELTAILSSPARFSKCGVAQQYSTPTQAYR